MVSVILFCINSCFSALVASVSCVPPALALRFILNLLIFSILSLLVLFGMNFGMIIEGGGGEGWALKSIPSAIPYFNLSTFRFKNKITIYGPNNERNLHSTRYRTLYGAR